MDENKDLKAPSGIPETAGDPASPALPPGSPAAAGEPAIEAKAALASIESPPLAPALSDMAAEAPGPVVPKTERPAAAEKLDEIKPGRPNDAAPAAREIVPFAAAARFGGKEVVAAATGVAVDNPKRCRLLPQMHQHTRQNRVLMHIGKIAGMKGVLVVHKTRTVAVRVAGSTRTTA